MSENKIDCTEEEKIEEIKNIETDDICWAGIIGLIAVLALFGDKDEEQPTNLENKE